LTARIDANLESFFDPVEKAAKVASQGWGGAGPAREVTSPMSIPRNFAGMRGSLSQIAASAKRLIDVSGDQIAYLREIAGNTETMGLAFDVVEV